MRGMDWNEEHLRWARIVIGAHAQKLRRKLGLQPADVEDAVSRMWVDLMLRSQNFDPTRSTAHQHIGGIVRNKYVDLARSWYDGEDARWRHRESLDEPVFENDGDSDQTRAERLSQDDHRQALGGPPRTFEDELYDRIDIAVRLSGAGVELIELAEDIASSTAFGVARARSVSRRKIRSGLDRLRKLARRRQHVFRE